MGELSPRERLQPSLLDRLEDDAPQQKRESRDNRVLTIARLRECVLRDLRALMNTDNMGTTVDLEQYPQVKSSVLNYGIPTLAGLSLSESDLVSLERQVLQAILDFEPRLVRETVRVTAQVSHTSMNQRALRFDIEGSLWAQPLPLHLFLQTEVDLESGDAYVIERRDA